ncbi:RNA polymerase sigma factor SigW [Lentibacillus jeotgali]|uniref:RNA polymerase sigma factor SigW n=1 Tax=Lentibacillus jeotgali TaxID=558169 RepID=UPI0002627407|nr:RNA polymerase sigma factor SigW [Lentibacillus jeotgali]
MNDTVKYLVKKVKQGDQLAFSELIELYQHEVYRICYRLIGNRYEAEDLAQEAFLRAYQNINSHDSNKKFSSWLFRIASNLTIDRLKKKKPDYYLDAEVAGAEGMTMYTRIPANHQLPEDQVIGLELQDTVQKAIFRLAPEYRSAIVLKYIKDLSLREISDVMQIPIGTVKTRLHRGRETLRKHLEPFP